MLALQNAILRRIARGDSLVDTIDDLCRRIERQLPDVICTVLTVDSAGLLHPLAAPSLPESFATTVDGLMIGPALGSCGTAAYTRKTVVIEDIESDPRWTRYRDVPLSLGLRACSSVPICGDDGAAKAVVALYYRTPRPVREEERIALEVCAELCDMALIRHRRVTDRERRATVDALTNLPNRAAFNSALAACSCDEPGAWALLTLDLDNLKVVNDTFGHQAGDALIQIAADRIQRAMSPDSTFRLGGDEFAIVVQDQSSLADLEMAAVRILAALQIPAECHGHTIIPRASIGGATHARAFESAQTVSENADLALYHAKEVGRGGFVRYRPGIGTSITRREEAVREVTRALDGNSLDAHYQPVLRLDTREIVGVEALCRIRGRTGAIVPARQFHEATRDAHVAVAWTERMLAIAAKDVRNWLDQGIWLQHVGLNISTADFYAGDLLKKLERAFESAGVSTEHLILEVNESVYMNQRDRVVANTIARLREGGVRIALDNFGTGHASLTHLLNVPVDVIKVDRSFVANLVPDSPSAAIVQGVVEIAHKLGIRVVAVGVETEAEACLLTSMGCKLGQGFAFAQALDRESMGRLLRRHAQGGAELRPPLPGQMPFSPFAVNNALNLRPTGTG